MTCTSSVLNGAWSLKPIVCSCSYNNSMHVDCCSDASALHPPATPTFTPPPDHDKHIILPLDLLEYGSHQAAVEDAISHFGKVCVCVCVWVCVYVWVCGCLCVGVLCMCMNL